MAAEVKLRTLRGILRELRLLSHPKSPTRQLFGYSFLLSEYRRMRTADQSTIHLMNRNAENYLSLLKSERIKEELYQFYKGGGESKSEAAARRVGYEMPKRHDDDDVKT
ncbi:protein FMC1 homolog [Actinia tenebrosa]|uniref:Protein FMC1 homolog n=1 Tax=Actinia tenebrosa TaxID=6105 RepID=A0A6P8I989_ACTTE|nr:protein FMC1 homolog [Actinia tenebrosa]